MVINLKSHTLSGKHLKELIVLTLFGALMYAVQVAMAVLPNIELVSLLVILITIRFGPKALFSVYIFVGCEILTYGISLWVINYLYIWAILVVIILPIRKVDNVFVYAIVAAIYGLIFGTLCAIPNFFIGGIGFGISYIVSGLMFDVYHCVGNLVLVLLLYRPLTEGMNRALKILER